MDSCLREGDEESEVDGEISHDNIVEEEDGPWFSMGMTKLEKHEARRPWRMSVIIKLVGRSIGYQFLLRRLQTMWRVQGPFALIDLSNDFSL